MIITKSKTISDIYISLSGYQLNEASAKAVRRNPGDYEFRIDIGINTPVVVIDGKCVLDVYTASDQRKDASLAEPFIKKFEKMENLHDLVEVLETFTGKELPKITPEIKKQLEEFL